MYIVNSFFRLDAPVTTLDRAHDRAIVSMAWHPLGTILATGSEDKSTRVRARAGARGFRNGSKAACDSLPLPPPLPSHLRSCMHSHANRLPLYPTAIFLDNVALYS